MPHEGDHPKLDLPQIIEMTVRPGAGFGLDELAEYLAEHASLLPGQEPPPLPDAAFVSMDVEWGEPERREEIVDDDDGAKNDLRGVGTMTWDDLAAAIARLTTTQRSHEAVLIEAFGGPDQRVRPVELLVAEDDVYSGISIGNVVVLERRQAFLRTK